LPEAFIMQHDFLYHPPDPADVARDWVRWRPVRREEAMRACGLRPVAVLHRVHGREAGEWLHPHSRFFRTDGPFLYEGLRYYVYTGAEMGKLKGLKILPPGEEEAWEEAEETEPIPLGSPTSKVPPTPKKYAIPPTPKSDFPDLPDIPDIPDIPDLPKIPDLPELPTIPDLPTLPGLPEIPTIPTLPGLELPTVPGLPEMPTIPGLPEVPPIPGLPGMPAIPAIPDAALAAAEALADKPKIPIEYRLLDGKGNPLPPTPFKVTLPDGTVKTGKSDAQGFIRIPDNTQTGQAKLEILDPGESDPAKLAAFAPAPAPGKKPIEIALVDAEDKPLADTPFKLKLPDGSVKEGRSDGDGFIRFPDNELAGDMELLLPGEEGAA
jgi:hypothetical protein